jgi:SAM-dependent methyltransferase
MKKAVIIATSIAAALALSYFVASAIARQQLMATFNGIYASGKWDRDRSGKGTSGPGSTVEITREYRAYVESFMKSHDVKSVVDAGCGDWSFASVMDWNGASYLGIDISSDVIKEVRQKYEKGNIKFEVGDVTEDLPGADLLLCKDVLQHLPNDLIRKFIKNNLRKSKYKWAILTNDRGPENRDIKAGEHRTIDLTAPPFEVKGIVDLPIKYDSGLLKITSLLDFTQ